MNTMTCDHDQRPLRIAQLAPLMEAVPPHLYGGTERVVSWLTEALVRRGHRVTLFASGDSHTQAELVPVVERAIRLAGEGDPVAGLTAMLGVVQRRLDDFDVIHSHLDTFAFPAVGACGPPLLTTLHNRLDEPWLVPVFRAFPQQPLVSISMAQRAPLPDARWVGCVHHGLPLAEYPLGSGGGDYALFLGRMSPEKRPHTAIEVARRAGMRLILAAKVDRADQAYFDEVVRPLLRGPGVDFVGEVDHAAKVQLLGEARALLFPIFWPEPFGLVMIEALACGAPVVTTGCGAAPEVVADGRVGFVCRSDAELVRGLERACEIDRRACRAWVEERFTDERAAAQYEALYRRLVAERAGGAAATGTEDLACGFSEARLDERG
jgi:glycosyltransferase involved in cell wall biosynthesis